MPQRNKVKRLYAVCVNKFSNDLLVFCQWLEKSLIREKYNALLDVKRLLTDRLPKW